MRNPRKRTKAAGKKDANFPEKSAVPRTLPPYWIEGLALVAIIGATILLFIENFSADFTYDDYVTILGDPRIAHMHLGDLFDIGDINFGWRRQVRRLTFMIDYALFGSSPTGYHLHNLLWHVLSVALFYVFVRILSQRVGISLLATLIFAIHPIHVEVVTNITNRKELLCMAFLLAAFIAYDGFIRGIGPKRWRWLTGCLVAWILALFSKQVAIVLPLYLIAYEYLFVPKEQRVLTRNRILLLNGTLLSGIIFITFVLLVVDLENLKDSLNFKGYRGEPTLFSVGITSARVFWRYVELLVWPTTVCPHHVVDLSRSVLEPTTLVSWVGLLALVVMVFLVAPRWPLLAFGFFWFLISYLPISNLIPTSFMLADRYMYIPSAGFCILLASFGETLYQKLRLGFPRYAVPVIAVLGSLVIAGYSLKTVSYNSHWKNEGRIWQYALGCTSSPWVNTNLGNHYYRAGEYTKAIRELSTAIELGFADAYDGRGNVFFAMNNYEEAMRDYVLAIAFKPGWPKAYYDRGLVFFQLELYLKAIEDYTRALELDPNYSEAYNNRGLAYENLDRRYEALEDYSKAVKFDQFNAAAHNNLGRALLYAGQLKEGIRSYKRAEELGLAEATKVLEFLGKEGLLNDPGNVNQAGQTP